LAGWARLIIYITLFMEDDVIKTRGKNGIPVEIMGMSSCWPSEEWIQVKLLHGCQAGRTLDVRIDFLEDSSRGNEIREKVEGMRTGLYHVYVKRKTRF